MKERDIVRSRKTGNIGVVVSTSYLVAEDGPLSVAMDGTAGVTEAIENRADWEVIGSYAPVPDMEGCGMGRGAQCCRFLGLGADGPVCLQFSSVHWTMMFKRSTADRVPNRLYPDCKLT